MCSFVLQLRMANASRACGCACRAPVACRKAAGRVVHTLRLQRLIIARGCFNTILVAALQQAKATKTACSAARGSRSLLLPAIAGCKLGALTQHRKSSCASSYSSCYAYVLSAAAAAAYYASLCCCFCCASLLPANFQSGCKSLRSLRCWTLLQRRSCRASCS
jgi:hypothetical protein